MAPYTLPAGLVDLDASGAQQYAANTGTELVVSRGVDAPPALVLDLWIKYIWLTDAEILTPGEGWAHVGERRRILSLGIEEELVSAGVPSASDAPGVVPSILYNVINPGAFPIASKLALVRFVPTGNTTEIVWAFKLTATSDDKTAALVGVVETRVREGLERFAAAVNEAVKNAKL